MPLADFTVDVEFEDVPRQVQVVVYAALAGLRSAATRMDNEHLTRRRRKRGQHADTLGVCHRFEWLDNEGKTKPLCSTVRFAHGYLSSEIVSHEMSHAAVWIRELHVGAVPLTTHDDEPFCTLLGHLVGLTNAELYQRGLYDDE